ncbi:MAG: LPS-assembly protein LptD [bacterium ADurb.Bin236]|nr:MAG: LPS-assembly protein LptD [bacterium ADurb.Bin236]HOY63902.1 hypothetical protein [bacterium]HPN94289.1 hypothetical protein [bacterium]
MTSGIRHKKRRATAKASLTAVGAALLFVFALALPSAAQDAPQDGDELIVIESADYMRREQETQITVLKGDVKFKYGDISVSCDEATLDENRKTVFARHSVKMTGPQGDYVGDSLFYNYDNEWFEIVNGSGSTTAEGVSGRLFFSADFIKGDPQRIKLNKARMTTCEPDCKTEYHLRAKEVTIRPSIKIVARDVYVFFGGTRSIYYPLYVISLKQDRRHTPEMGYNKTDGFYVNHDYAYLTKDNIDGWALIYLASKKGAKYGAEHMYTSKRLGGDGRNWFLTNREKDTGNSTNMANVTQKLNLNDRMSGDFSFNRTSSFIIDRPGSRRNTNRTSFNLTRSVREIKEGPSGTVKGAERRRMTLGVTTTTTQTLTGESVTGNYNFGHTLNHSQKLNTNYTYRLATTGGTNKTESRNADFRSTTTYTGDLYRLTVATQKSFDLSEQQSATKSLNTLWPKATLALQPKLYSRFIPLKYVPITAITLNHERIRQGTRSDSEALRHASASITAAKTLLRTNRFEFKTSQRYDQSFYSTTDANYLMTHSSDMSYYLQKAGPNTSALKFNFSTNKDSGGWPNRNTVNRESSRLRGEFAFNRPKTTLTMNTQYDYRAAQGSRYSPMTILVNRSATQNTRFTLRSSRNLNTHRWGYSDISMELRRKNTLLNASTTWDTEKGDLRAATLSAASTRSNGWKVAVQSSWSRNMTDSIIKDVVVTKERCCTIIEMKYNTTREEFQLQYIIRAFPQKRLGFTQSERGFDLDDSFWTTQSQTRQLGTN